MEARGRASDLTSEEVMALHLRAIAENADKQAFAAVFNHYGPRVKAYLMRRGGDAIRAEEVTQETMVAVWRKARLFDPERASPATWIFTIARNQRIDAFRREKHPEIDPDDPALRADGEPHGEAVLEGKQSLAEVARAVAGLPEGERQLLMLAYYEDKSHTMIAAELGIPLGTVKSRMRQVFRKLRLGLAGVLGDEP